MKIKNLFDELETIIGMKPNIPHELEKKLETIARLPVITNDTELHEDCSIKVFELVNTNCDYQPEIIYVPDLNDNTYEYGMTGQMFSISSWSKADDSDVYNKPGEPEYIAGMYIKFDGCSHWYFKGEDYNGEDDSEDSYYHICGFSTYTFQMRALMFGFQLLVNKLGEDKVDSDEYKKFINFKEKSGLLEGYIIREKEYTYESDPEPYSYLKKFIK